LPFTFLFVAIAGSLRFTAFRLRIATTISGKRSK